jgi:hypothetical protein
MGKSVSFLALNITLLIVEMLISFICLIVIDFTKYNVDRFFINKAWIGTGLWNFWRLLFFGLPFILLYLLLFKFLGSIKLYKPLLFSLFNLSVYVGLSVLTRVVWDKNVPLPPEGIMFWITCTAIFLSPIILGQIPYFNKIMQSL